MNEYDNEYWQRIKEWLHAESERRARQQAEAQREAAIFNRDHDIRATETCPCCQGTGRLGIVIGAKDDQ